MLLAWLEQGEGELAVAVASLRRSWACTLMIAALLYVQWFLGLERLTAAAGAHAAGRGRHPDDASLAVGGGCGGARGPGGLGGRRRVASVSLHLGPTRT